MIVMTELLNFSKNNKTITLPLYVCPGQIHAIKTEFLDWGTYVDCY